MASLTHRTYGTSEIGARFYEALGASLAMKGSWVFVLRVPLKEKGFTVRLSLPPLVLGEAFLKGLWPFSCAEPASKEDFSVGFRLLEESESWALREFKP